MNIKDYLTLGMFGGTTALDKLPENQNIETTNDVIKNSHMYYGSDPKELGDTRER